MGVVYEAVDRQRGAPVALKRLDRLDATALYRFKREFRARADLVHPNLVTLHELVGDGDAWFFTMELLDGVDLLAYLRANPARLRAALGALVDGLSALHDAGLVHRDVKPSNVLVTGDDRVVLLDFGLIQRRGIRDSDDAIVGTPAYLAPELVTGTTATPAADLYAVGVMLYEVLAGRQPFDAEASLKLLMDKTQRDPPDVRVHAPDAPPDLADLAMALLARDPRARPDADAIRRVLGEAPRAERAAAPESAPFIGRAAELARLREARARVARGGGALVLVHGESGIGKSRLCRELLDEARRDGALVLEGRCYERETVPYQGVDSLVDALASHLAGLPAKDQLALLPADAAAAARLFPVLRRLEPLATPLGRTIADEVELRRRGVAALRGLFARLAARRPVVLFLDDLQWSDADTARVVAELMREPPPPVLVVGAYREAAGRGDAPRALAALPGAVEVPLAPLSPDEAEALAAALLGDAARARDVARESAGHPLFAHELARHGGGAAATSLRDVLAERIARLRSPERRLLEAIAAAGRPLPLAVVERAVDADEDAAARLRAEHLIRSHGARTRDLVEPYHDQIRDAALAGVADVPALLGRLALALEASGTADPEALASFWRGAGDPQRAARYAEAAAERAAATLAFERAAELYEQALALSGDPTRTHALRLGLGRALASAGRGVDASRALRAAVATAASAAEAIELERQAAEQLLRCGRMRDGIALFEEVFRATGVRYAPTPRRALLSLGLLRARVRLRGLGFTPRRAAELAPETLARIDTCWAAASGIGFTDVIRGAELQARGLLAALAAGEPYRVCRALAAEACFRATAGGEDDRGVLAIVDRAEALARELDSAHGVALCGLARTLSAYCRGRWRQTVELAAPTVQLFAERCTAAYWEASSARHLRLWALAYLGRFDQLAGETEALLADADLRDDAYARHSLRTGLTNMVWLARDRPEVAEAYASEAMASWPGADFGLQDYGGEQTLIEADLYRGEVARAAARLDALVPALRRAQLLAVQQARIEVYYLRAVVGLARGDLGLAPRMARRLRAEQMRWADPIAASLEATVAARRGDDDAARAGFAAAAAGFDAADMAVHAAIARRRLGERTGGDQGAALVAAADARMRELGIVRPDRWAAMWTPLS